MPNKSQNRKFKEIVPKKSCEERLLRWSRVIKFRSHIIRIKEKTSPNRFKNEKTSIRQNAVLSTKLKGFVVIILKAE